MAAAPRSRRQRRSTSTADSVSRLTQLVQNPTGTSDDLTLGYSYNPAGQIASTTRSNDAYAWGGHYQVNRNYSANGLNQYTAAGSVTPTYDNNGNVTSAGTPNYSYTSDNQLTAATGATMAYDPAGRMATVTYHDAFGYDGANLTVERDWNTAAITRRYVHGPGIDEPLVRYDGTGTSNRIWLHQDERGSVIALSDGSGAVTDVNSYDEYGIPASGNVGRFQYTGLPWLPQIGMQNSRNRIYSPTMGRFMQTDPIGVAGGINLYGYVWNDPVTSRSVRPVSRLYGLQRLDDALRSPSVGTRRTGPGKPVEKYLETRQVCGDSGEGAGDICQRPGQRGQRTECQRDGPAYPVPNLQICSIPARILVGNSRFIGRENSGFHTRITNNSAAIIPRQFGASGGTAPAWLRSLGPNVWGWTPTGQHFNTLTDVIDNRRTAPTAIGAQDIIMARDPGLLIVEIMGGRDERTLINIVCPAGMSCPSPR